MTQADSTPKVLGRSLEDAGASSPQAFRPYPVPAYSPLVYTPARNLKVQEEPLDLGLPNEDPKPSKDCPTCADFIRQRAEARKAGDWSKASDCNVEIWLHPHKWGD